MECEPLKNPVIAEYWMEDETERRETEEGQDKPKKGETAQIHHDHINFPGEASHHKLVDEVNDAIMSKTSEIQDETKEKEIANGVHESKPEDTAHQQHDRSNAPGDENYPQPLDEGSHVLFPELSVEDDHQVLIPEISEGEDDQVHIPEISVDEDDQVLIPEILVKEGGQVIIPEISVEDDHKVLIPEISEDEDDQVFIPEISLDKDEQVLIPEISVDEEISEVKDDQVLILEISKDEDDQVFIPEISVDEDKQVFIPQISVDKGEQGLIPEISVDKNEQDLIPEISVDEGDQVPFLEISEDEDDKVFIPEMSVEEEISEDEDDQVLILEISEDADGQVFIPEISVDKGEQGLIPEISDDKDEQGLIPEISLDEDGQDHVPETSKNQNEIEITKKESPVSAQDEVKEICFSHRHGVFDHSSKRLKRRMRNVTAETDTTREISICDTYHVIYNTSVPGGGGLPSLMDRIEKAFWSRPEIQISGAAYYIPGSPQNSDAISRENTAASRDLSLYVGEDFPIESNRMQRTPLQLFIAQVLSKMAAFIPASKFIFHQPDQRETFVLSQDFFRMSCADKAVAVSSATINSRGIDKVSLITTSPEEGKYALMESPYPVVYKDSLDVSLPCCCPVTMTNTLMIGNEKKQFENMEVLIISREKTFSACRSPSKTLQFLIISNDDLPGNISIPRTVTMASRTGLSSSVSNTVLPHKQKYYVMRVIPYLCKPLHLSNLITEAAEETFVCQFCKFKSNKLSMIDHYRKRSCEVKMICMLPIELNKSYKPCQANYIDGLRMQNHLTNVHKIYDEEILKENSYYQCEICKEKFEIRNQIYDHLYGHTERSRMKCDYCTYSSSTEYYMTTHKSRAHGK